MRQASPQAGAEPGVPDPMDPLEPDELVTPAVDSHAEPTGRSGAPGPQRSRDPRSPSPLTARDLEALARVGRAFELAQYQVHEWLFAGRVESIVSRFVGRMVARGMLARDRLGNGTGMCRVRLTARGRDTVVAAGVAEASELFVGRSGAFVQPKDVAHTYWTNDVCLVLGTGTSPFDTILPSWASQRRAAKAPAGIQIPDVLAVRRRRHGDPGLVLAIEIDLGGERLRATFCPKLSAMATSLAEQRAVGARAGIVVLTRGAGRAAALKAQLEAVALPIPAAVELLPNEVARPGLKALRALFAALGEEFRVQR